MLLYRFLTENELSPYPAQQHIHSLLGTVIPVAYQKDYDILAVCVCANLPLGFFVIKYIQL